MHIRSTARSRSSLTYGQKLKEKSSRRLAIVFGAILVLLPLLAWAGLIAVANSPRSPVVTAADPLTRSYIEEVAKSIGTADFSRNYWFTRNSDNPICLDDEVYAGWEAEFGDDPRFWFMRYAYTKQVPAKYRSSTGIAQLRPEVFFLEEARRRQAVDGPLLLALLSEYHNAWANPGDWNMSGYSDWAAAEAARQAYVAGLRSTAYEMEEELIAELLNLAPNDSMPYYYISKVYADRGDLACAFNYLTLGNNAPDNVAYTGSPHTEYIKANNSGQLLSDRISSGLICWSLTNAVDRWYYEPSNYYYGHRSALMDYAIAGKDLFAVAELHKWICRAASMDAGIFNQAQWGSHVLKLIRETVLQEWQGQLTPRQFQALGELEQKLSQLETELQAPVWGSANQSSSSQLTSVFDGLINSGAGGDTSLAEWKWDRIVLQQSIFAGPARKLYNEIETFDYAIIDWKFGKP